MSEHKPKFWPGTQRPLYGGGVLSCKAGLMSLEYHPNAVHAIACIDGCLGIEDPETTVPDLMKMCNKLLEGPVDMSLAGLSNEAAVGAGTVLDWVHTLVLPALAKTGSKP